MQIAPIPSLSEEINDIRLRTADIVANRIIPNEGVIYGGGEKSAKIRKEIREEVKKERLQIINDTQEEIVTVINSGLKEKMQEVLVEGRKKGKWFGRYRNDKLVFFTNDDMRAGQVVDVKITETSPWYLEGSIHNEQGKN